MNNQMERFFYSWVFRPAKKEEIAEAKNHFEEFQALFAKPKKFKKGPFYVLELKETAAQAAVYKLVTKKEAHQILKQFLHMTEEEG